jgi:cobaltochelatase CobN
VTLAGDNVSAFERLRIPLVQAIPSGMSRGSWEVSRRGLNALETAINVALPEFDGRIISVPFSFKERGNAQSGDLYVPHQERADRVAE